MAALITASAIFIAAIVLILTERLDRTIVAISGAAAMVGVGAWLGYYGEEAAVAAIDFETLGLLFGMMVLVAMLKPTGFFEYLATLAASRSRGNPVRLLILLGSVTTVLSMFLDNVTTVVLIAPVTILVSEILGLSPVPFLISEALLSNTGGVATLVGDPPNVLIGSAAGLSFNDFLIHTFPVVVFAWPMALGLLLLLFRRDLAHAPRNPEVVLRLIPREALHDWPTARKLLIVLGAALGLFLLQEALKLTPSFIALSTAAVALVWIRPPIEKTLDEIEWSVLVFFVGLFVMVGGLEAAGALEAITQLTARVTAGSPVLAAVGTVWVVAALSALVDNVPITVAMIPVIQELGTQGVVVGPLWWALAFGAGFGGNGTIIGSTANVVVAGISRRTRQPITSNLWNRRGLPVMILTTIIASLAMVVAYPFFLR
jgi:Na+/H+ antiporter NhaD/arsenite permease-like protein